MANEPPYADPLVRWCGEGWRETSPYPISCFTLEKPHVFYQEPPKKILIEIENHEPLIYSDSLLIKKN